MSGANRYEMPADAMLQIAEGESLLVKLVDEEMYALNQTGTEIVRRIVDGQTVDSVIGELSDVYGADRADVARDVQDLIQDLVQRGLLVVRDDARRDGSQPG